MNEENERSERRASDACAIVNKSRDVTRFKPRQQHYTTCVQHISRSHTKLWVFHVLQIKTRCKSRNFSLEDSILPQTKLASDQGAPNIFFIKNIRYFQAYENCFYEDRGLVYYVCRCFAVPMHACR